MPTLNRSITTALIFFATSSALAVVGHVKPPTPDLAMSNTDCHGCQTPMDRVDQDPMLHLIRNFPGAAPYRYGRRSLERAGFVGRMALPGDTFTGTAVLVSPCHVLTNHHVAFSDNRAVSRETTSRFFYGQTPTGAFEGWTRAVPVAWGNYCSDLIEGTRDDWALLRLDTCVGTQFGYADLQPMSSTLLRRKKIVHVSIPYDTPDEYKLGARLQRCDIREVEDNVLMVARHRCDALQGSSGSALIDADSSRNSLLAIHARESRSDHASPGGCEDCNLAIPVGVFYARVLEAFARDSRYINAANRGDWMIVAPSQPLVLPNTTRELNPPDDRNCRLRHQTAGI